MDNQEQIWQVGENNTPIGPMGRDDSRKLGLVYRIVRTSIKDMGGNVEYLESYEQTFEHHYSHS